MKEFVNPNLHAALVHYPLAMLVFGSLIELFAFLWPRSTFRTAGRWMILLGAFTAIPIVTSGIYALRDVATMHTDYEAGGGQWKEVVQASKLTGGQWATLRYHLLLECFATGVAVIAVVTWIGCSDRWRTRLHWPLLIWLLVSVNLAAAGAYHGGEAVYVQGTGVLNETVSKPGEKDIVTNATVIAASGATATKPAFPATSSAKDRLIENINFFMPPAQVHVIMAGIAVAFAMASMGLSIRKYTQGPPLAQVDHLAEALGSPATLINAAGDDTIAADTDLEIPDPIDAIVATAPAGKFWLLTALLALITAGGGYVLLALDNQKWAIGELWHDIAKDKVGDGNYRQFAHVLTGISIILLPIVLALVSRLAPRGRLLLVICSILLVVVIAAQIWFGVALLYDSSEGALFHFN